MRLTDFRSLIWNRSKYSVITLFSAISHVASATNDFVLYDDPKKNSQEVNEILNYLTRDSRFRTSRAFFIENKLFNDSKKLLENLVDYSNQKFCSNAFEVLLKYCKDKQVFDKSLKDVDPTSVQALTFNCVKNYTSQLEDLDRFVMDVSSKTQNEEESFLGNSFLLSQNKDVFANTKLPNLMKKIENALNHLVTVKNKDIESALSKILKGFYFLFNLITEKNLDENLKTSDNEFLKKWRENSQDYKKYENMFEFENTKKDKLLDLSIGYFISGLHELNVEITCIKPQWKHEHVLLSLISDLRLLTNWFNFYINFSKLKAPTNTKIGQLLKIKFNPCIAELIVIENWVSEVKKLKLPVAEGVENIFLEHRDKLHLRLLVKNKIDKKEISTMSIGYFFAEDLIFKLNSAILANFLIYNKVSNFSHPILTERSKKAKNELFENLSELSQSNSTMISSCVAITQFPIFAQLLDIQESNLDFDKNNVYPLKFSDETLKIISERKLNKSIDCIMREYPRVISRIKNLSEAGRQTEFKIFDTLKDYNKALGFKDAGTNELEFLIQSILQHIEDLDDELCVGMQDQLIRILSDLQREIDYQINFNKKSERNLIEIDISHEKLEEIVITPIMVLINNAIYITLKSSLQNPQNLNVKTISSVIDGLNCFSILLQVYFISLDSIENSAEFNITYFSYSKIAENLCSAIQSAKDNFSIKKHLDEILDTNPKAYFISETLNIKKIARILENATVRFVSKKLSTHPVSVQCLANVTSLSEQSTDPISVEILFKLLLDQEIDRDLTCFSIQENNPENFDKTLKQVLDQKDIKSHEGLSLLKYFINFILGCKIISLEQGADLSKAYFIDDEKVYSVFNNKLLEILQLFEANSQLFSAIPGAKPAGMKVAVDGYCKIFERVIDALKNFEKDNEIDERYKDITTIANSFVQYLEKGDNKAENIESLKKIIIDLKADSSYIQTKKNAIKSISMLYELLKKSPYGDTEKRYHDFFKSTDERIQSEIVNIQNKIEKLDVIMANLKVKMIDSFKKSNNDIFSSIYISNIYQYGMNELYNLFIRDFHSEKSHLVKNLPFSKVFSTDSTKSNITTYSHELISDLNESNIRLESFTQHKLKIAKQELNRKLSTSTVVIQPQNKNEAGESGQRSATQSSIKVTPNSTFSDGIETEQDASKQSLGVHKNEATAFIASDKYNTSKYKANLSKSKTKIGSTDPKATAKKDATLPKSNNQNEVKSGKSDKNTSVQKSKESASDQGDSTSSNTLMIILLIFGIILIAISLVKSSSFTPNKE